DSAVQDMEDHSPGRDARRSGHVRDRTDPLISLSILDLSPFPRKGGLVYGKTDDYGYYAVENKVHLHDLHATILHLLGLDHTRLTYRYAGRNFRLTDVYGEVVHDIVS